MPWFKFTEEFRHRQAHGSFRHYPAGWEGNVTSACAEEAESAGKGSRRKKPSGTKISKAGRAYEQPSESHFLTDPAPEPAPEPESSADDGEG